MVKVESRTFFDLQQGPHGATRTASVYRCQGCGATIRNVTDGTEPQEPECSCKKEKQ